MSRIVKFIGMATALLASQISNATPPSGKLTGWMDLHKGTHYICEIEIEIDISGSSAFFYVKPDSSLCGVISNNGSTYSITYSGNKITLHNVEFTPLAYGGCYGDLTGEWDGTELIFDTVLPAKTYGSPCIFIGYVS